jgi:hypothetical protein
MHAEQREALRQKYRFSEWSGEADAGLLLRGFGVAGQELAGFELVRTKRSEPLGRLDTFWQPADHASDVLLGAHFTECASISAARLALLETLGDFQSDALRRRTDLGIGDVAFGDSSVLLFSRGNLVVLLRNAGRRVIPVLEPGRALDAYLVRLAASSGPPR